MSIEWMSPPATKWIKENPIKYDADGRIPRDLPPAITTKRKIDRDGNFLPEGETTVPRLPGMSENFHGFLSDFFNHGDLDALEPHQRRFLFPYISEVISTAELARREHVIYQNAYNGIKTGLQSALYSLPPEMMKKYMLREIWQLKSAVAVSKPRNPNKVALSVNPNSRKPSPQSAEIHRYAVSSALGIRVTARPSSAGARRDAPLDPLSEFDDEKMLSETPPVHALVALRKQNEDAMAMGERKLNAFLKKAYDMSPEERAERPMGGALFNWVFVQTLPEDLIRFYVDHPDLEVDRWKKFSTNPRDSFVSFAYGQVCYTVYGDRSFMYASSIAEHFRRDNLRGDPAAFKKFAMLRWPDIQRDIEITAMLGGYRKPLPART